MRFLKTIIADLKSLNKTSDNSYKMLATFIQRVNKFAQIYSKTLQREEYLTYGENLNLTAVVPSEISTAK